MCQDMRPARGRCCRAVLISLPLEREYISWWCGWSYLRVKWRVCRTGRFRSISGDVWGSDQCGTDITHSRVRVSVNPKGTVTGITLWHFGTGGIQYPRDVSRGSRVHTRIHESIPAGISCRQYPWGRQGFHWYLMSAITVRNTTVNAYGKYPWGPWAPLWVLLTKHARETREISHGY